VWEERILTELNLHGDALASKVAALVDNQKENWAMLGQGYQSLAKAEVKRFRLGAHAIIVQHNPGRIHSTSARVDRDYLDSRPCFLCPAGLPPEEKGIEYNGDLIILCNPFPIFEQHLTIVSRQHVRQQIAGNLEKLLGLARDLGSDYFSLYNGPECGASAPDHLHFQACRSGPLPIEEDLSWLEADFKAIVGACELRAFTSALRSIIAFRGGDPDKLALLIYGAIEALREETKAAVEPMINLCVRFNGGLFSAYLFPRSRHRPSCYYAEGDRRLMISPGAIDMAGVMIAPERDHFEKIDTQSIRQIFSEVSLGRDPVIAACQRLIKLCVESQL
jgi:ATP adenylyltransferase/5',5'''-P-1,P-4-tetraphosphate phosphorylase II